MNNDKAGPALFDDLADHFVARIDDNTKGALRRQQLHRDLAAHVLTASDAPLRILEVGAGTGRTCQWLLSIGPHHITCVDASAQMVERARERLHQHLVDGRVTLIHAALEDFVRDKTAGYDLVLAHALLEWLPDPWRGLEQLLTLVRPGGWLSLAVYNTAGRRVRQITRGEVAALRNPLRPGGSRLAPLHSFGVDELDNFLSKVGCERLLFAGLRTVSDYLPAPKRETLSLDELNALDEQYRLLSPFREMSTYLHMLWKVPDILKSRQHLNGPDRPRHHRPE